MRYRNRKLGFTVAEEDALEYALYACGLDVVNPVKFEAFAEDFEDIVFNLDDWDIEEDEDDDDDEGEVIDLEECNRKEWLDLMRERVCV